MNLFRQQKFSIRKFNVGIFSALIATALLYLLTRQQRLQQSKISLHKINQHNQLMPIHSLMQMLVLQGILQHSQQTKVDRLIQQEEQHNQLDKVIKLIRITLHNKLEIKKYTGKPSRSRK
ncbi:YSIRK-type signal peptide-containing protein [Staphylococcus aureus]